MKKKIFAVSITMLLVLATFAGCTSSTNPAAPEAPAGDALAASKTPAGDAPTAESTINIWCWDNSQSRLDMHGNFTADTGIAVDLTAVESKDMTQKLQTTLAAGGTMPDIAWLEATYRGKLLSLNIWEDITADPYNFDVSQVLDYMIPLETSEDGKYVGPECPSVAGMAFKRELALEYFGTEDPAELEALLPDWEAFKQAGIKVQEKSGGKVFMLPSLGSAGQMFKGSSTEPFIIGDKLNLEASMLPILQQLIEFKRLGVCDILDFDSPEEGASYADNLHIFYPCANWSVEFTIKANDKEGQGRWGFMIPPEGAFPWGGNVMGVPQGAANKEDAVEYIKYFFASEPGAILQRDFKGNFSPYKPLYEDDTFYSGEDPFFKGQNVLQDIGQRVLPAIKGVRLPSKYDQDINDAYNLAVKSINASDGTNITAEDLIAQMKDDLINKQPTITE